VGSTPGNDMNLSVKKVEANRNFANKVWNAARFVINAISEAPAEALGEAQWTLADRWIRARLVALERDVERLFRSYQFGEAGRQIYDFFWSEFADWYLEVSKLQLNEGGDRAYDTVQTLVHVLDTSLRMLHPFTPFVTEELWGHLKQAAGEHPSLPGRGLAAGSNGGAWEEALIIANWPEPTFEEEWETKAIEEFSLVMDLVRAIRNLRAEQNVPPGKRIPATLVSPSDQVGVILAQSKTIVSLAYLDEGSLEITSELKAPPPGTLSLVVGPIEVFLPLEGVVDLEGERARIEKELKETKSQVERLETLLSGPFAEKAPPQVVQKERDKLEGLKEKAEKLSRQLQHR
jgi:valyl-tRNA synthetase